MDLQKRQKQILPMVLLTLMMMLILVPEAFAYGEQLESSVTKFVEWGVRILGYIGFLGGGVWAAIDWMMSGGQHVKKALSVILGGVFLISLPKLYTIIQAAIA
jgi:hypothetical protein